LSRDVPKDRFGPRARAFHARPILI